MLKALKVCKVKEEFKDPKAYQVFKALKVKLVTADLKALKVCKVYRDR